MVKPVLICVPLQMAYYQLGAASSRRPTGILLETGRNSFADWFPTGIYTSYVSGFFRAGIYPCIYSKWCCLIGLYENQSCLIRGIWVAADVHFEVYGPVSYPGSDSMRAGPHLSVLGDTSDGEQLPVITDACPLTSRGSLSENRQFGEVVPAVDGDVSSVECGVETKMCRASPPMWYFSASMYRVYSDCVPHSSLRGKFIAKFSEFTNRPCAAAHSVAKCGRDLISSPSYPAPSPLGAARCTPDHDPPAWKAAWALASVTSPADGDVSSTLMFPLPLGFACRNAGSISSGPVGHAE